MENLAKSLGKISGVFFVIAIIATIMAFPTMWLWNYVMPYLFGLKEINFWMALCINLLSGILFRSNTSSK